MKKVYIETMGCQMNKSDSERIAGILSHFGYVETENEKDELVQISKETFYPKRNYAKTLSESDLDEDKKNELINFIRENEDIKKHDAKELLNYIKNYVNE